jgi:hypothetical protein
MDIRWAWNYLEIIKTQYLVKKNSDNGYSIDNLMDVSVDNIFLVPPSPGIKFS